MINRYYGNSGKVVRVSEACPHHSPVHSPPRRGAEKPPVHGGGNSAGLTGLKNLLGGILPGGIDMGDAFVLLLLLLLYIDSRDPDFIIMLIVLGYDVFKGSQLLSGLSGLPGLSGLSGLLGLSP